MTTVTIRPTDRRYGRAWVAATVVAAVAVPNLP